MNHQGTKAPRAAKNSPAFIQGFGAGRASMRESVANQLTYMLPNSADIRSSLVNAIMTIPLDGNPGEDVDAYRGRLPGSGHRAIGSSGH
jgi:hypothetical protein